MLSIYELYPKENSISIVQLSSLSKTNSENLVMGVASIGFERVKEKHEKNKIKTNLIFFIAAPIIFTNIRNFKTKSKPKV
jgi:hypothetical protein